MDLHEEDPALKANRLIYWGLHKNATPQRNEEYLELVNWFLSDTTYRDKLKTMAGALELEVLGLDQQYGIYLGPNPKSLFQMSWTEYNRGLASTDSDLPLDIKQKRALLVIVNIAIAFAFFPDRSSFNDYRFTELSTSEERILKTLLSVCGSIAGTSSAASPSNENISPAYKSMALVILELVEIEPDKKTTTLNSLMGIVEFTLRRLLEFSFIIKDRTHSGAAYFPTKLYQTYIYNRALGTIYEAVFEIHASRANQEINEAE